MDLPYEFKKVTLDKDHRWTYKEMMFFLVWVQIVSVCNLVLFAGTWMVESDRFWMSVTNLLLRWLLLLFTVISIILGVFIMTRPKSDFQFEWCYRVNAPQDMVDDYMNYDVLTDNPSYRPPMNASVNWKKQNPTPAPTIRFDALEKNVEELQVELEDKEDQWRRGDVSDLILQQSKQ